MTSPLSLPVAQLRSMGCKVSTLFGHDPRIGCWKYGITLPKGVGAREFTDIDQDAQAGIAVHATNDGRVIYTLSIYRPGQRLADEEEREVAASTLARRLESAAGYLKDRLEANKR